MGELYELYPKLPKNIRQIGERDTGIAALCGRLCEYIFKAAESQRNGQNLRVGLLLGNREIHEDMPYVFVDGAMEMELLPQDGEKVVFTEEAWKRAYQQVETDVPKKNGSGLVFMRRRRHYLKSAELLAAAQPVFYRKKPADVFKQRSGWGRSGLHHIHRWLLSAAWLQHLL